MNNTTPALFGIVLSIMIPGLPPVAWTGGGDGPKGGYPPLLPNQAEQAG